MHKRITYDGKLWGGYNEKGEVYVGTSVWQVSRL
jgi:hypothetical protein